MKRKFNIIGVILVLLSMVSCSEDRVILEKGAGFYEITKKEIIKFDSLGNQISVETEEDYGYLVLFAKSGSSSTGIWSLNGQTLVFEDKKDFSSGWAVGPTDEKRFVMSQVFTLEGWGQKKIKLTYLKNIRTREVFHLTRN